MADDEAPPGTSQLLDSIAFSSRKPRNLVSGLSSGTKNIARGVGLGVAALVSAPFVGYEQNGWKGAAIGTAVGLVSAPALIAAGVVTGAAQVVRGTINTREEIGAFRGKHWDQQQRKWVEFDPQHALLADEAQAPEEDDAETTSPSSSTHGRRHGGNDSDDLYAVLQVAHDADEATIKKQYYKLARAVHPDRNPSPEANVEFQELSRAYQVLSNPETRRKYDTDGEVDPSAEQEFDASIYFAMLFGSAKFDPWVGDLTITLMLTSDDDKQAQRACIKRIVRLAQLLEKRLADLAVLEEEAQSSQIRSMASGLVVASFGPELLGVVAQSYKHAADSSRGGMVGAKSWVTSKFERFGLYAMTAGSVISTLVSAKKANSEFKRELQATRQEAEVRKVFDERADEGFVVLTRKDEAVARAAAARASEELTEEEEQEHFKKMSSRTADKVLKLFWTANALDIDQAVQKACKAVLAGDAYGIDAVSMEERRVRQALLVKIAAIFREVAEKHKLERARDADEASRAAMAAFERAGMAAMIRQNDPEADVDAVYSQVKGNLAAQDPMPN